MIELVGQMRAQSNDRELRGPEAGGGQILAATNRGAPPPKSNPDIYLGGAAHRFRFWNCPSGGAENFAPTPGGRGARSIRIVWGNGFLHAGWFPNVDAYGVELVYGRRDLAGLEVRRLEPLYEYRVALTTHTSRDWLLADRSHSKAIAINVGRALRRFAFGARP